MQNIIRTGFALRETYGVFRLRQKAIVKVTILQMERKAILGSKQIRGVGGKVPEARKRIAHLTLLSRFIHNLHII